MKTAYATIKGFEIMRMIRRRHCILIEAFDPSTNSSISPPNRRCGASQILIRPPLMQQSHFCSYHGFLTVIRFTQSVIFFTTGNSWRRIGAAANSRP